MHAEAKLSLLLFSLLLICISCSSGSQNAEKTFSTTSFEGWSMTVPYKIIVGKVISEDEKEQVQDIINRTFHEIDIIHNNWNPSSEISHLNESPAFVPISLSKELEKILILSDKIHKITNKRFDPSICKLLSLYRNAFRSRSFPSQSEIDEYREAVGWDHITIQNGCFEKNKESVHLDLCGISKGYAIDLLVERLTKEGFSSLMIDWGGEIKAIGKHPAKRPWKIRIFGMNEYYQIPLENQAIATSGDYMFQSWKNEKVYFHIIDPIEKTLLEKTEKSIVSASVIAPSCAWADALATAAMTFPNIEEAQKWAQAISDEYPEIHFYLISKEM